MHDPEDIPNLEPYKDAYTQHLHEVERIANLLDARYTIPGTKIRFGWDALIGLLPVLGDTLSLLPQLYLLYKAQRLQLGWLTMLKMLLNILIDWAIGSVPILGDLFDVAFKSNLRNAKLTAQAIRDKRQSD
ncbi:MAG: DUF4112 domain-containing protein [Verrucomicrobia bacterium]|jgi:hypothetical protein|nr:DUF4112 domain-containing protein [Verrucomicrobiota bacterium]